MTAFLNALSSVSVVLILTMVGYFFARFGWMQEHDKTFITKLLMNVAIPCNCIYGLTTRLTHDLLANAGFLILVPILGILACYGLSYLVAKHFRMSRKRFGVFMAMCSVSNAMFIGLPMCTLLFGSESLPYIMFYYIGNSLLLHCFAMPLIRWSGASSSSVADTVKGILTTPPIYGTLIGFIVILGDLTIPQILMSSMKYMSDLVSPLALLMTGYVIQKTGIRHIRLERDLWLVMAFRFLIQPALCIFLCAVFMLDSMARSVFAVESAMPVISLAVVAATNFGADEEFAASGAALSTLLCFIVIPVLMVIV